MLTFLSEPQPILPGTPISQPVITDTPNYGGTGEPTVISSDLKEPISDIGTATAVGSNLTKYVLTTNSYDLPPLVNIYREPITINYIQYLDDIEAVTQQEAMCQTTPLTFNLLGSQEPIVGIGVNNRYTEQKVEVDVDLYSLYQMQTFNNILNNSYLSPPSDNQVIPVYNIGASTESYTQTTNLNTGNGFNLLGWLDSIGVGLVIYLMVEPLEES